MKIEQILYTRMGGAELGAGWQPRTSDKFSPDVKNSCIGQFNSIVDSLLDKTKKTPDEIYTVWHASKRLCAARARKLVDQTGRGNILAQAYVVNEAEYISVLTKPSEFLSISEFYDEIIDNPPVLDALPRSESLSVRDICQKYSITSAKMEQIIVLILSAAMKKNAHKKALRIVVNRPLEELYRVSQEIMSVVFSFVPRVIRLNTSFASFEHEKLEGMTVLFTNTVPSGYYYNMDSGDWSWPAEMMIPEKELAKTFIANQSNLDFHKDIEDYVLQTGKAYSLQWDDLVAAYIYAAVKNNINVSFSEKELFRAMAAAVKDTSTGISEAYLAMLAILYMKSGGILTANHAEALTARYNRTQNPQLKTAIEVYNFTNYVEDFNEQKFTKFCSLQRTAPDVYNSVISAALEQGKSVFLGKVEADIVKSRDLHMAFEKAVTEDTKRKIYMHMVDAVYCNGSEQGYSAFAELKKRVPDLFEELHRIALTTRTDALKDYYAQYAIPKELNAFDPIAEVKRMFGANFDDALKQAALRKVTEIFTQMCRQSCTVDLYRKYKETVRKICGSADVQTSNEYENMGKRIFWDNFSLSAWRHSDSYGDVNVSGVKKCDNVRELERMVDALKTARTGDRVYTNIMGMINSSSGLDDSERSNVLRQIHDCIGKKHVPENIDDMVLKAIRADKIKLDINLLQASLEAKSSVISESSLRNSVLLPYIIKNRNSHQSIIAMYKNLMSSGNTNPRFLDAFEKVCTANHINVKKAKSEVRQGTRLNSMQAVCLSVLTALCVGAGLKIMTESIGALLQLNDFMLGITIVAAIIIFAAAAIVPGIKCGYIMGKKGSIMSVFALAVVVIALMSFGSCFSIPTMIVAVLMLIPSIALCIVNK